MTGTFRAGRDDVGKILNFSVATLSARDLQQLQIRQRTEVQRLAGGRGSRHFRQDIVWHAHGEG